MTYRKIITIAGLILMLLSQSACLRLFGGSKGGGVGMDIELPKFASDRPGSSAAAQPAAPSNRD